MEPEWLTWHWAQLKPWFLGTHLEPRFLGTDLECGATGVPWILGPGQYWDVLGPWVQENMLPAQLPASGEDWHWVSREIGSSLHSPAAGKVSLSMLPGFRGVVMRVM